MSGGSYNYQYTTLLNEYEGRMHDAELNSMIKDLAELLHDLEWWVSGDYSEERYRLTSQGFKDKWFGQRDSRITEAALSILEQAKDELAKL